jgi:chemotaxis-related protein WspB
MLLLTFTVGADQYAIDVARVVEIVPRIELRKIPHAPAFVAGLLGYRGKVVPVIDLCTLLDVGPCQDCLGTRIILVNDSPDDHSRCSQGREGSRGDTGEARAQPKPELNLLGLVAEHVSDLTDARREHLLPAPVRLPQTPYLGPIVHTDQGIVQLIVVEKIRDASLQSSDFGQNTVSEPKSESLLLTE